MRTTMLDFKRPQFREVQGKETGSPGSLWKTILGLILALTIFGAVEVFSASRYFSTVELGNPNAIGILHIQWIAIAAIAGLIVSFIPSSLWKKFTVLAYIVLLIALIAVFFMPDLNGAHRWLYIGSKTFQPSEAAKLLAVLFGAQIFAGIDWSKNKTYKDHIVKFALAVLPIAVMLLLILLEPDLGNVVVIGASFFVMYLLSPSRWKKADVAVLAVLGVLVVAVALILEPYRFERIKTYVTFTQTGQIQDEWNSGLQLRNILIGVGSGGLWGKGIGQSRLRHGYFVEATAFTDSIAAVIFEELGFFLSILFVGIYVYLFMLMAEVAEKQKNQYQRLFVWGLATWFIVQTLFHLAANVALMPVKGITLPFVSYGGSSILMFGIFAGMLIRLARNPSETA